MASIRRNPQNSSEEFQDWGPDAVFAEDDENPPVMYDQDIDLDAETDFSRQELDEYADQFHTRAIDIMTILPQFGVLMRSADFNNLTSQDDQDELIRQLVDRTLMQAVDAFEAEALHRLRETQEWKDTDGFPNRRKIFENEAFLSWLEEAYVPRFMGAAAASY